MKIEVDNDRIIVLKEVFSGVLLESRDKEQIGICMRDSGFEITYGEDVYSFQQGYVTNLTEEAMKNDLTGPIMREAASLKSTKDPNDSNQPKDQ